MTDSCGFLATLRAVREGYEGARRAGIARGIKNTGIGNGIADARRVLLRSHEGGGEAGGAAFPGILRGVGRRLSLRPHRASGCAGRRPVTHRTFGHATQVVVLNDDGDIEPIVAAHDAGGAVSPLACTAQVEGGRPCRAGRGADRRLSLRGDITP